MSIFHGSLEAATMNSNCETRKRTLLTLYHNLWPEFSRSLMLRYLCDVNIPWLIRGCHYEL